MKHGDLPAKAAWSDLAQPGASLTVTVTPAARLNAARRDGAQIHISVTAAPEDGKATAAARDLLAHALGIARTRLTLLHGATSRTKVFRLDQARA